MCSKILVALLAVAPLAGRLGAAPDGVPRYHYHYFKEKRPLRLDPARVALLRPVADTASRATAVGAAGLEANDVQASSVLGWNFVRMADAVRTAPEVEALVDRVSEARLAEFVSPVFLGDDGGPVVVTPVILVGFDRNVTAERAEAVLAASKVGSVVERDWANMDRTYRLRARSDNGFGVLEAANGLAQHPDVTFAEPDMLFSGRGSFLPNDPLFDDLWGLHNTGQSGGLEDFDMDAPEAWDISTGDPFIITVILDTGVEQDHPDINQVTPGIDTTSEVGDGGPINVCDNHGTAVSGCVSATIDNNLGVVGVAPTCRTASARAFISNLDCGGGWSSIASWTVDALAWAESIGARVTNNSNYYGFTSSAIAQKYEDTRNGGMVHFASASNDAVPVISYPASLPTVNAIAALNRSGSRASFSNWGEGLAFSAPGQSIGTTDRTGADGYNTSDYAFVNGTSFASPYSAGVAALALSVAPGLSATSVESIMQQAAIDLGATGYDTDFGWGLVNARQTVRSAYCTVNDDPDLCDCLLATPPVGASSPQTAASAAVIPKNRFLSVEDGNPGSQTAIRVTFNDLPATYASLNGEALWVGPPQAVCENAGQSEPPAGGCSAAGGLPREFMAATLQCLPFYADWSTFGRVHVYHEYVIPDGRYALQAITDTCDTDLEANYSGSLSLSAPGWADVVSDCSTDPCGAPNEVVNVQDVLALLNKFQNLPGALTKVRADLAPGVVNFIIDVNEVLQALDAFSGASYPFAPPAFPCGAGATSGGGASAP